MFRRFNNCKRLSVLPLLAVALTISACDDKTVTFTPPPPGGIVFPPDPTLPKPPTGQYALTGKVELKRDASSLDAFIAAQSKKTTTEPPVQQPVGGSKAIPTTSRSTRNEIIVKVKDAGVFQRLKNDTAEDKKQLYTFVASSKPKSSCALTKAARCKVTDVPEDPENRDSFKTLVSKKQDEIRRLYNDPSIEVFPNYVRTIQSITPPDKYFKNQWHYPAVRISEAWQLTLGKNASHPIRVAIIDTGIKHLHPDFKKSGTNDNAKIVAQAEYDFISSPERENDTGQKSPHYDTSRPDSSGPDANAEDPGDSIGPSPSSYHGTHVAGTIAAYFDNGTDYNSDDLTTNGGGVGVAPEVEIIPLRVLGVNGGDDWDIAAAIRYAAGLPNPIKTPDPNFKADIINMSFGGPGDSPLLNEALTEAHNAGVILVAAAGNSNTSEKTSPASHKDVIAIGAVGQADQLPVATTFPKELFPIGLLRAPYSNFGPNVDIMAPGGNKEHDRVGFSGGVFSTLWRYKENDNGDVVNDDPTYAYYEGTSMAAPHISGIIALMKAVYKDLTPDGARHILYTTAVKPKDIDPNPSQSNSTYYGQGLVDAFRAVSVAKQLSGDSQITLNVVLRNKNDNNIVQKKSFSTQDAYAFNLEGIQKGEYTVKVGTDFNDNHVICEAGDFCGELSNPISFDNNRPVNEITISATIMADDSKMLSIGEL